MTHFTCRALARQHRGGELQREVMRSLVIVSVLAASTMIGVMGTASPASAEQVVGRNCNSGWIGWAEYRDYGDNIKIRIRPTKRAWAVMGAPGTVGAIWDADFKCIPWDDGFSRLSQTKWNAVVAPAPVPRAVRDHRRLKSGDTFDYEFVEPQPRVRRGDDACGRGQPLLVFLRVRSRAPCCSAAGHTRAR